jgi:hypothetical protein
VRTKLLSLCILLTLSLPARPLQLKLVEGGSSYVYCVLMDNVRSVIYVSGVFPSQPSRAMMYATFYHDYLHRTYPRIYGTPTCTTSADVFTAQRSKSTMESHYGIAYRSLIETGWKY